MSTPPIIIIAEPDPMISSVLRVEFTNMDFAVFLAASGEEAEDYAAHTVAHLIVLDAKLHLGAFDACARIRRRQGYAFRPIVLTALEPSPKVRTVAEKAGATVLLPKPYSVGDLFCAIEPFLAQDDLLLTHRARGGGVGEPRQWGLTPPQISRSGSNSALTRNGQLLPIVRKAGVKVPFLGRP